ncbi:STY4851/ECs_5259 family protein [Pectobacterium actinidiae]|uniref:STY4851/ECs_5259 family protein n=1 Tax=Pectobacterium actinidiae TaxID=1507808 RepID=UPI004040BAAB
MSQSKLVSVFKCTPWLTKFLTRRSLKKADGRPLYEYHATNDEYADLKQLLRQIGQPEKLNNDKGYAACFTLFCSEWYRRDYGRDCKWSWDPIHAALNINLSHSELGLVVPKGLEDFWERPIRFYESERRNFLGSLFSEGGLPFKLLKETDSRFQSVFSRILNQYEQASSLGYSTSMLVQMMVEKSSLPQGFREDTSIEFIARMAEQLISLVQLYDLSTHAEPVKELGRVHPKWRDSFPIPLDDDTGTSFLNGLLRTASVENKPRQRKSKVIECFFSWSEQKPDALHTHISLPEEMVFPLLSEPSTTRFELAVCEDGEDVISLGSAYATLGHMQARLRLRKSDVRFQRHRPATTLSLVARAGGVIIGIVNIAESEIPVGDVPLVFVRESDEWLLQGVASCSVRSSNVLIILPEGGTLSAENAPSDFTCEAFGYPALVVEGRHDILIEGEEIYRIRAGLEQARLPGLGLQGKRLNWTTYPEEVFLGPPHVMQKMGVPAIRYRRFLSGKDIDMCELHDAMGTHFLSIRNENNETLLRRKIGILPADFQVEIKSGERANEGLIVISTQYNCLYALKDKTLEVCRRRNGSKTEIVLKAEGVPPASVQLQVTPSLMEAPVGIVMPFPSSGCLAFDAEGRPLAKNITITDLLGSRAFLFGKNGEPTRFTLELRLRSNSGQQAWHEWRYNAGERPLEVNLYSLKEHIENLLFLGSGIDQIVDMRIRGIGGTGNWQIRRYKYSLEYDPALQILRSNSVHNASKVPSPVIMLLSEPERRSIPLASRMSEGVPVGEFELGSIVGKNGPWLVLPKSGEETAFRPCFIRGEPLPEAEVGTIHSLQKATRLFKPGAEVNTISLVLDRMANDPAHSGWQFLQNLYSQFSYLPLATFEVWRALFQHPQALALSLFKFEMSPEYLGRIESEFPVFWEFLPIQQIKNTAAKMKAFMASKGASAEMQSSFINKMYQRLGTVFPTYSSEIYEWLSLTTSPRSIPPSVMKDILQGWYQELLREHGESRWPEYGGPQLYRWIQSQADPVIEISSDTHFRYAVAWLPVFAAAVASGKTTYTSVFGNEPGAVFFLRQVRDFDSRWFNALFQYCLLRNITEK